MKTMSCAEAPLAPFQAVMWPVIEAKMKLAGAGVGVGVGVAGGGVTKSVVVLPTAPVGRAPGMLMVCGFALSTTGPAPFGSRTSCVVLDLLLATQKGLVFLNVRPHGLVSSGSSTGARPGTSEMRFVCR